MAPRSGPTIDARRIVQLVALGLALSATVYLLAVPTYSGQSTTVTSDGTTTTVEVAQTLLAANGPGVLGVLLLPVLLTAVPALWWGRGRTAVGVTCAVLLLLLCVVGLLTVGVFFFPAAVVATVALVVPAWSPAPPKPDLRGASPAR